MKLNEIIKLAEERGYTIRKDGSKVVVTFPGKAKEYRYSGTICDVAQRLGIITEDERTETRYADERHTEVWVAWVMRSEDSDVVYHRDQWNIEGIDWYRDYRANYPNHNGEQMKMYQKGNTTNIAY